MKQEHIILLIISVYYTFELLAICMPSEMVFGYVQTGIGGKNILDYVWLIFLTFLPYFFIKAKSFNVDYSSHFKYGYYLSLGLMIGFSYSSGLAVPYILLASSCKRQEKT